MVVSSHTIPELGLTMSLGGIQEQFPRAARNLFVVHLDPKELLADQVRNNFPSQFVADTVLKSQIYNNLIEVAPGLKEFQFLARMQQLAERTAYGVPNYDLLLWDAPSSGHFLSTLHAAKNFETFLSGPLAAAGADLARFLSNMSNITLLPVTTLEEMALEETIEMCARLEAEYSIKPASVLLNMVSPLVNAAESDIESLRSTTDPALRFAVDRGLLERERAAELMEKIPAPQVTVVRARHWDNDLDLLHQLGHSLDRIAAVAG